MQTKHKMEAMGLVVWVPKELDHHHAETLRMDVERLLQLYHVKDLIFDFAETDFMDSSGIGVLIGRCKNLGYCNGSVYARNLNRRVQKIFRASGLEKIIITI